MKRAFPWNNSVSISSDDDSSSSSPASTTELENFFNGVDCFKSSSGGTVDKSTKQIAEEGLVIKRAEMYQEYMNRIPIPVEHGSVVPFTSWIGLGNSLKQLYGQPLHYLTNVLLKQWDAQRIGSKDEHTPLDELIHPVQAEATVWLVEQVNRVTASHHRVAKLWLSDPMYQSFVDSIFPQL